MIFGSAGTSESTGAWSTPAQEFSHTWLIYPEIGILVKNATLDEHHGANTDISQEAEFAASSEAGQFWETNKELFLTSRSQISDSSLHPNWPEAYRLDPRPITGLHKEGREIPVELSIAEYTENGEQPSPRRDLAVVINLDRGEIAESAGAQFSDDVSNADGRLGEGDCKKMTQIPSPDHTLVAYCMVRGNAYSVGLRDLTVPSDGRVWSAGKGWAVTGVVWGGNSDFVAVLLEHERTDLSPLGMLSMSSGHPIQLDTFKVTLLSKNLDHQLELPLVRKAGLYANSGPGYQSASEIGLG